MTKKIQFPGPTPNRGGGPKIDVPRMTVDPSTFEVVKCSECESIHFVQCVKIRKVPVLYSESGTDKERTLEMVLVCKNCGQEYNNE